MLMVTWLVCCQGSLNENGEYVIFWLFSIRQNSGYLCGLQMGDKNKDMGMSSGWATAR